jgi:hypothetical protein
MRPPISRLLSSRFFLPFGRGLLALVPLASILFVVG